MMSCEWNSHMVRKGGWIVMSCGWNCHMVMKGVG